MTFVGQPLYSSRMVDEDRGVPPLLLPSLTWRRRRPLKRCGTRFGTRLGPIRFGLLFKLSSPATEVGSTSVREGRWPRLTPSGYCRGTAPSSMTFRPTALQAFEGGASSAPCPLRKAGWPQQQQESNHQKEHLKVSTMKPSTLATCSPARRQRWVQPRGGTRWPPHSCG